MLFLNIYFKLSSLKFADCKVNAFSSTSDDIIFRVRYSNMSLQFTVKGQYFTFSDSSKIDLNGIICGTNSSVKANNQLKN